MSEIGTMKELNVHPGDVVENQKSMMHYPITEDMQVGGVPVRRAIDQYRIISRAKPLIDLTTNTSAWGLCSDEWRAVMRAHDGPVEQYTSCGWRPHVMHKTSYHPGVAYRAKPDPVVTTVTNDAWVCCHQPGVTILGVGLSGRTPGTLTTTFHDGKPVKAEWVAT